ncbi:MAG: carboxylate--amine ligase [Planctomycetota bacterium]|jgi:predicted ATP-grasp superfamily ATP-dependent carboligase
MPRPAARVLLTGVTVRSGLAVAEALARSGHRVAGCDFRRFPFGLRSRFLERFDVHPRHGDGRVVDRLVELCRSTRADVLYPMGTAMVTLVARHRERFERVAAFNVPPLDAVETAGDNERTMRLCHDLGIPAPAVHSPEEARERLVEGARAGAPVTVVVKPRRDVGGGLGVSYVTDAETLRRRCDACAASFDEPVIQEFVPGPVESMRAVLLLFDRRSRLVSSFTIRKLHQWPSSGGITAAGISTDDQALVRRVLPFFERCGWTGPAEVELKVDPRDDEARLIEINPRFSGYIAFPVACGLNLPALAVATALDADVPTEPPAYRTGLTYVNGPAFARSVLAECRGGGRPARTLREAARLLRAPRADGGRVLDDAGGRAGKLALEATTLMARLARRNSPAPGRRSAPPPGAPPGDDGGPAAA